MNDREPKDHGARFPAHGSRCPARGVGIDPGPFIVHRFRLTARRNGFTLLEVMAAMAILALFIVPLLGAVISGISSIERTRNLQLGRQLALNKLDEIGMEVIPEMEMERSGDFAPEHPEIEWRIIFRKRPELELLEQNISGLITMEVEITVSWPEGEEKRELVLTSIFAR